MLAGLTRGINLFRCLDFVALVEVVGVQLLVAEVAAGFTVVLLVDGGDVGVLVALADGLALVLAVDGFHALASAFRPSSTEL